MVCMTLRIAANALEDAEKAYTEAFSAAPPEHILGNRHGGIHERSSLVERAVRTGVPLVESELGSKLAHLEGEYTRRLGGSPKIGFLWYQDGEESLAERIAILEECLRTGKRRLMVEYGDGEDFPERAAVSRLSFGDRMKLWLGLDGRVLW